MYKESTMWFIQCQSLLFPLPFTILFFFFFFFLQGVKMVILLFYFLFSKKSFLFEYEGFVFRNVQFGQTQHGF